MACSECKKKKDLRQDIINATDNIEKKIVIFVIGWSILGLYGLYSLVSKFL